MLRSSCTHEEVPIHIPVDTVGQVRPDPMSKEAADWAALALLLLPAVGSEDELSQLELRHRTHLLEQILQGMYAPLHQCVGAGVVGTAIDNFNAHLF